MAENRVTQAEVESAQAAVPVARSTQGFVEVGQAPNPFGRLTHLFVEVVYVDAGIFQPVVLVISGE